MKFNVCIDIPNMYDFTCILYFLSYFVIGIIEMYPSGISERTILIQFNVGEN